MLYLSPVFANFAEHNEHIMRRCLVALVALIAGRGPASTPAVAALREEVSGWAVPFVVALVGALAAR